MALSGPRIVGGDSSPSQPGHLDLPYDSYVSASKAAQSSPSNRRTDLVEIPTRTAGSHKESRKAKRQAAKRGSVGSNRTAKVESATNTVNSDAPVASENRDSGAGFLRRIASLSGISRKNV